MEPLNKDKRQSERGKPSESIISTSQISVAKSKEIEVGGFGLINDLIAALGTCLISCILCTARGK